MGTRHKECSRWTRVSGQKRDRPSCPMESNRKVNWDRVAHVSQTDSPASKSRVMEFRCLPYFWIDTGEVSLVCLFLITFIHSYVEVRGRFVESGLFFHCVSAEVPDVELRSFGFTW